MDIKFGVYFPKSIGTLYKDNEIDTLGKEGKVDLDLNEVSTLTVTFKVGEASITDYVTIKDIENGLIQIPFKNSVIKQGLNSFEIEALMKNGDVKTSQTYSYYIEKSLENENSIEAETNYPILIQLLSDVQNVKDAELIRVANEQARQTLKDEVLVLKTNLEGLQVTLNSLDDTVTGNENTRVENEQARQTLKASLETLQTNLNSLENNISSSESIRQDNEADRILEVANKVKEINDKILDVENRTVIKESDIENKIINVENRTVAKESLIDNKILEVEARTVAKETLVNNKIVEANTTIDNVNIAKNNTITATTNANTKISETEATRQSIIATINNLVAQFNALAPTNSTNAEVQLARTDLTGKTFASLQERLISDNKGANITYTNVEGTYNTITDSVEGKVQNIEILGSTYQDPNNLSIIKSCCNVLSDNMYKMSILSSNDNLYNGSVSNITTTGFDFSVPYKLKEGTYYFSFKTNTVYNANSVYLKSSIPVYNRVLGTITRQADGRAFGVMTLTTEDIQTIKTSTSNLRMSVYRSTTDCDAPSDLRFGVTNASSYIAREYNKSEILLPCQLEKVGTVADRLYFDLVKKLWCVEKNISTLTLDGSILPYRTLLFVGSVDTAYVEFNAFDNLIKSNSGTIISNKFKYNGDFSSSIIMPSYSACCTYTSMKLRLSLPTSALTSMTNQGVSDWLKTNNTLIKYQVATPTIIELPLSTQIALNSFMGTTHYYTDDTEIEPTLRGKFAKSLSAGYESLHNKTDILGDRIAGLEGLKDSQEFAYKTSTGYLNCLNTKDASVDNLKLTGRTLNQFVKNGNFASGTSGWASSNGTITSTNGILTSTAGSSANAGYVYTPLQYKGSLGNKVFITANMKVTNANSIGIKLYINDGTSSADAKLVTNPIQNNVYNMYGIVTLPSNNNYAIYMYHNYADTTTANGKVMEVQNVMALDLTALGMTNYTASEVNSMLNGYFEGMKSTGFDTNEIEVLTVKADGNIISDDIVQGSYDTNGLYVSGGSTFDNFCNPKKFKVSPSTTYQCGVASGWNIRVFEYDKNKGYISQKYGDYTSFATSSNTEWVSFRYYKLNSGLTVPKAVDLTPYCVRGTTSVSYSPMKSHKKQILSYNSSGQLVAVPELRGIWSNGVLTVGDTVEKHSDGKWYWHKRMSEKVLNGSEDWVLRSQGSNVLRFSCVPLIDSLIKTDVISDKFTKGVNYESFDYELIQTDSSIKGTVYININKSKLSTQDVAGFKAWLSTNPVTVAYQLQTEEVYEVIDLHFDSYANETMISLNAGAISPYVEFAVSSYMPNFVKDLNERVKLLEEKSYKENITMMTMLLNHEARMIAKGI